MTAQPMDLDMDVLVVGGGPAGLSAAASAAAQGARVLLADESPSLGGQLRYRLSPVALDADRDAETPSALAARLVAEAEAAGADLRPGMLVWGGFEDGEFGAELGGRPVRLRPTATVVATGSTDLPLPFPGGSLPGVFTGRAALILANLWGVLPGRRWAVVGAGPEAEEVAASLQCAGAEIVARAPGGAKLAAEGRDGVVALWVNGDRHTVDAVAACNGRQPDPALATMLGVALGHDPALGGLAPLLDELGATGDPRVFVCGDAAGICSPEAAVIEGRLAGIAAAASCGLAGSDALDAARAAAHRALAGRVQARRGLAPSYVQPYR